MTEVTTDALDKLLASTENGWRSGGALHIAFTADINANLADITAQLEKSKADFKKNLDAIRANLVEAEEEMRAQVEELRKLLIG
jgi:uncharacterized protein YqfA (UPF0365 family)